MIKSNTKVQGTETITFILSNFYNVLYTRIFVLFTLKILLKYDFWHSHVFVAVAIKVQPFESACNGTYKELNFICQQCFLNYTRTHGQIFRTCARS